MKQAEIEFDRDYIVGPATRLWDDLYSTREGNIPWRMKRMRCVDSRLHQSWNRGRWNRDEAPRLVSEGDKPDRSLYVVGALFREVKADGTLGEPVVERPGNVRMEFDAWRAEYDRKRQAYQEGIVRSRKAAEAKAEMEAALKANRERRLDKLNGILEGTGLEAVVGRDGAVVLAGAPADLLEAAHAFAASKEGK